MNERRRCRRRRAVRRACESRVLCRKGVPVGMGDDLQYIDEVYISPNGLTYEQLDESRKWISGRFERNIGTDQATSGAGQKHAHVYGRKGNEIVAVNFDGTASHGTKGKLGSIAPLMLCMHSGFEPFQCVAAPFALRSQSPFRFRRWAPARWFRQAAARRSSPSLDGL